MNSTVVGGDTTGKIKLWSVFGDAVRSVLDCHCSSNLLNVTFQKKHLLPANCSLERLKFRNACGSRPPPSPKCRYGPGMLKMCTKFSQHYLRLKSYDDPMTNAPHPKVR